MHAVTKMSKIRLADIALTNLTKIRKNRQFHKHSFGLTKFRHIYHLIFVTACISGHKRSTYVPPLCCGPPRVLSKPRPCPRPRPLPRPWSPLFPRPSS